MAKQYYNGETLERTEADYKLALGGRNIGKSYDIKKNRVLQRCIETNKQFIYLRRWKEDISPSAVENYFADLNICEIDRRWSSIFAWRNEIFLCNRDEKGKPIDKHRIGFYHSLSQHERYKSQMFPEVDFIIFEEFITADKPYLPSEPDKLQEYTSTIFRERKGTVYMIGNTLTRLCPYFSEWKLDNVPRQKKGTIDIYENTTPVLNTDGELINIIVKVAVEKCTAKNIFSKMAFGSSASMITKNEWKTKSFPRLNGNILLESESLYTIYCICDNLKFRLTLKQFRDNAFWYVEPFTKELRYPEQTRIIQPVASPYSIHTTKFTPLSERESKAFSLLRADKIFYCNNETGTDFTQALHKIGF